MLGQKGLDLVNGPGEGTGVDSEELGEEIAGAEFVQVEHGGQDSVGGGQFVLGLSAPGTNAFASSLPGPSLLTCLVDFLAS